jgi:hypothetical protein
MDTGGSLYIENAGLIRHDKWTETLINNNQNTLGRFEEIVFKYREQLKNNKWSDEEIDAHISSEKRKLVDERKVWGEENMVQTLEDPKQSAIIIKQSWNKEFGLNRRFQGVTEGGKPYTRPAVGDGSQQVKSYNMVFDNWRVAAHVAGVHPNTLQKIGRDNINNDDTTDVLDDILGDEMEAVVKKGDVGFDTFLETDNAGPIQRGLDTNPDMTELEIKQFTITKTQDPEDLDMQARYDMMIDVGPKSPVSSPETSSPGSPMDKSSPDPSSDDSSPDPSSDEPMSE